MIRTRLQGDTPFFPNMLNNGKVEVCLKEDVDKVIAEKDAEIVELKKQVHDYALGLYVMQAKAEKEARHHKYKRCLDKAALCERMRIDAADCRIPREKWEFYDKWHWRWLELAEKFKPNKEAKR